MQYDPFQQQAIDYINQGHSVIVSAPTGSGKTAIAEHVIRRSLQRGEKVIYTSPIKALSNQKFRDFQQEFPDQVGILTGDVSLNTHAPALIMTTEIFRNKILEENNSLKDYTWIIFDEIHFLDDPERGSVWEEALIFLPDHMNVLGLSATIPNIDELTRWLESIHAHSVKIIQETKRPVPLHFFYQCQDKFYDDIQRLAKDGYRAAGFKPSRWQKLPRFAQIKPNRLVTLVQHLLDGDMLPCIYFVFSRRRTEELAEELKSFNFLDTEQIYQVLSLYDELCERFELKHEVSAQRLRSFVQRGIAYHHAGMLPTLKEVVERLFTSRLIRVIFTTETFALGVNMPARTVVFDEMSKFYGRFFDNLKTRDFYQMAGRAGRRSIDKEGHVFCRINPHNLSPADLQQIVYGQPEKVSSRFNASYATLLNLYQAHADKIFEIYPKSFHHFQENEASRRKAVELLHFKIKVLEESGCISKKQLTAKGLFAAKVYGYELIFADLFERGILENLPEQALGILILAAVYEPRKGTRKPALSRQVKDLQKVTDEIYQGIHRMERRYKIRPFTKECFYHLAPAMAGWLNSKSFDEVLRWVDADEGEVVRYFRMTIQVLRDIAEAEISHILRNKIEKLIYLIDRDVVDAEKQLRG